MEGPNSSAEKSVAAIWLEFFARLIGPARVARNNSLGDAHSDSGLRISAKPIYKYANHSSFHARCHSPARGLRQLFDYGSNRQWPRGDDRRAYQLGRVSAKRTGGGASPEATCFRMFFVFRRAPVLFAGATGFQEFSGRTANRGRRFFAGREKILFISRRSGISRAR